MAPPFQADASKDIHFRDACAQIVDSYVIINIIISFVHSIIRLLVISNKQYCNVMRNINRRAM